MKKPTVLEKFFDSSPKLIDSVHSSTNEAKLVQPLSTITHESSEDSTYKANNELKCPICHCIGFRDGEFIIKCQTCNSTFGSEEAMVHGFDVLRDIEQDSIYESSKVWEWPEGEPVPRYMGSQITKQCILDLLNNQSEPPLSMDPEMTTYKYVEGKAYIGLDDRIDFSKPEVKS